MPDSIGAGQRAACLPGITCAVIRRPRRSLRRRAGEYQNQGTLAIIASAMKDSAFGRPAGLYSTGRAVTVGKLARLLGANGGAVSGGLATAQKHGLAAAYPPIFGTVSDRFGAHPHAQKGRVPRPARTRSPVLHVGTGLLARPFSKQRLASRPSRTIRSWRLSKPPWPRYAAGFPPF